jgi:DNA-binding transcriptional ArsR family regulator
MDQDFCAQRLKILADRTRLGILQLLLDGPRYVGDLNLHLQVEQSLLSHHLSILRKAGLVQSRREGPLVLYQLAQGVQPSAQGTALMLGCCTLSFEGN